MSRPANVTMRPDVRARRFVVVFKDRMSYVCLAVRTKNYYEVIYRCGKCLRGNLGPIPEIGSTCRVCHSKVVA